MTCSPMVISNLGDRVENEVGPPLISQAMRDLKKLVVMVTNHYGNPTLIRRNPLVTSTYLTL